VFEGLVDKRGGVAEIPEHRPQRVHLPRLPTHPTGTSGDRARDPQLVQIPLQAAVVFD